MGVRERVTDWLLQRPALAHTGVMLLARRGPVVRIGGQVLVLGHGQVTEVLSRSKDFRLADSMRGRIVTGPFLLDQEPPGHYEGDRVALSWATYEGPTPTPVAGCPHGNLKLLSAVGAWTSEFADSEVAAAVKERRPLDAVGGLLERAAVEVVNRFIIGPVDAPATGISALTEDARALAELIVTLTPANPALRARAENANISVANRVEARLKLLSGAPQGSTSPDVVSRLYSARTPPADIKRLVGGLVATGVATIARAGGQALDQMLHRPIALLLARDHLQNTANPQARHEFVVQFLLEALRFNPMFFFIPRTAARNTQIVGKSGAAFAVRAGEPVLCGLLPAMFDPRVFPDPERFSADRPKAAYLHFGHGVHRCFGARLAETVMAECLGAILRRGARRALNSPRRGALTMQWPAARHLDIEFC